MWGLSFMGVIYGFITLINHEILVVCNSYKKKKN